MDIPARIRILAPIRTGSVYYFEEESLSSKEPHYFIVLNRNPRTEEFLLLVCASSQIEKRKQAIERFGFPPETLVLISPAEYPLFTKPTVIDCNHVFEKNAGYLIEKLEQNRLKLCTEIMPDSIIQKILAGVLVSSEVSNKVREVLSP